MIPIDFQFPDLNDTRVNLEDAPKRPLLERMGDTDDWLLQLDNTTASVFQTCPRASKFYTVDRRQRPDRAPLIFGGAIHEGLEQVYKHGFAVGEQLGIPAILAHFERHPINTTGEWRTPAYAVEAFQQYCAYWSLMDTLEPLSSEWVEKPFSLNIGQFEINAELPYSYADLTSTETTLPMFIRTLHVQWSGKIDIIATNGGTQKFVVDHKTSSMGGPTFFADFELSQQTHGYMWAAQEILGEELAGFILNALLIRKPTRTGVGIEFDRKPYFYEQASLVEWKSDMLQSVENYVHSLTTGKFPKYTAWCMGKYGKCQYHDVCVLPENQRRFMLHSGQYSNVVWSPLNSD